jgi:phage-related protein
MIPSFPIISNPSVAVVDAFANGVEVVEEVVEEVVVGTGGVGDTEELVEEVLEIAEGLTGGFTEGVEEVVEEVVEDTLGVGGTTLLLASVVNPSICPILLLLKIIIIKRTDITPKILFK